MTRKFEKLQRRFHTLSQSQEPVTVEQYTTYFEAATMGNPSNIAVGQTRYQLDTGEPVQRVSDTEFRAPISKLELRSEEPITEDFDL